MIEDVILAHSQRGVNELRAFLSPNFCEEAARFLYRHMRKVLLTTGFYVDGCCETDGPVSTIMLGDALREMGSEVAVVTDIYCQEVLERVKVPFPVHVFPITGEKESEVLGEALLSRVDPSLIVSVERCGKADDNRYYNMRGEDISQYTARIDVLAHFPHTIGVGDGGNEIGMGNVHAAVRRVVEHGEKIASVVKTSRLVVSTVSNWGVYGLLAYLSQAERCMLLKEEDDILRRVVAAGAIDSGSLKPDLRVDGFSVSETAAVIEELQRFVE